MKVKIFTILSTYLLACASLVFADVENAPPNYMHGEKKAVFVDFKTAQYDMIFDAKGGNTQVTSTITFEMPEAGYPLFDSISTPSFVSINTTITSQKLISVPGNVSVMRMVQTRLTKGLHTLKLVTAIEKGTKFDLEKRNWGRVSAGFFIRDLKDRMFLEQYLPTNYEYDQYKMDMDVKVQGTKKWHNVFSNGKITKVSENHYKISMPKWYSASSVFFHLVPITKYVRWYLTYPSIDGRDVPVTIYSNYNFYNNYAKAKAFATLDELEADYGPYPHDSLTIYGTGLRGGMEHAGAMETSIISLGHEMQHMYFAKAIHPVNGNSGWLDEAIASWRDKGHQAHDAPFYTHSNIGNHSVYTRKTDKRSYAYGRSFMAYLNKQLMESGDKSLKSFLRYYFQKRKFTTVSTEDFKNDLEEYSQMSFGEDFHKYIYGTMDSTKSASDHKELKEDPNHPHFTQAELDSII